ncbi:hypothetical protein WG68_02360 [Arsukibacterium ikkense]|uniref:Capsular biosynthesis protein CpsB n=1 Tax=Arsukibacterium ikkense TaxID=336831 RepID=A0A0M2VB12_9GAMM|nr:outer membrane beta-barrel protein [Arsukibacterium ikkense]KKO46810.1 hypothetical protein WG68_02360 [Arsukibacterium ikkense]
MFNFSCVTLSLAALGVSATLSATEYIGGSITTETGIDFTPMLQTRLSHDNNIASTSEHAMSSWLLAVTPLLRAQLKKGPDEFSATARLARGHYMSSSDDNYLDFFLGADAKVELNENNRFDLDITYRSGHEKRGTGVSEGMGNALQEPVTFEVSDVDVDYEYGALSTPARLRLMAGWYDKAYSSHGNLTRYRSYQRFSYGAAFYYNTQASIRLLSEVTRADINYEQTDPTGNRDNTTTSYRMGMEWQATALTSAGVRFGYQHKDFESLGREDFKGLTWQASLAYAPLSYSQWRLSTGRLAKEPNVQGDYVEETLYGISWRHNWSELLASTIRFAYSCEDFAGSGRSDKTRELSLAVSYLLRANMLLTAGTDLSRKVSTARHIRFDKNIFYVGVQAGL